MGSPPEDSKPTHITKNTYVQLGVAIAIGGLIFMAGTQYEKVNRLDGIKIEQKFGVIMADLTIIKLKLGLPVLPVRLQPEKSPPNRHTTGPGDERPNIYR
jgi:hypothetical protein